MRMIGGKKVYDLPGGIVLTEAGVRACSDFGKCPASAGSQLKYTTRDPDGALIIEDTGGDASACIPPAEWFIA